MKQTILVVDDHPSVRTLVTDYLAEQGYRVLTASDGNEGLAVARRARPDLVLLDVMMPGLDGFGVVRRLRQSGRHTPVLFLTARDAPEDKVSGLTLCTSSLSAWISLSTPVLVSTWVTVMILYLFSFNAFSTSSSCGRSPMGAFSCVGFAPYVSKQSAKESAK